MTIRRTTRRKLIRRHDAFIKRMLDQPGVARSLLREHLPATITARLIDEDPERLPDSFISARYRESRTDRLFRIRTKSGRTVFLYVLVEHKSAPDPRIGLQLLTYIERIYVWWASTLGGAVEGRLPGLPAVIPLVIYNGRDPWTGPLSFADGIEAEEDLRD